MEQSEVELKTKNECIETLEGTIKSESEDHELLKELLAKKEEENAHQKNQNLTLHQENSSLSECIGQKNETI
jgi:hypothetical protein